MKAFPVFRQQRVPREGFSAVATLVDGVASVNFLDMRFQNVFRLVRLSAYVTADVDGGFFDVAIVVTVVATVFCATAAVFALLMDFQILTTDER